MANAFLAQLQAEGDRLIHQLSTMVHQRSQLHAEKAEVERKIDEQHPQREPRLEKLQRARRRKMQAMGMSGGTAFPSAQATSPASSPAVEGSSPSQSPTPAVRPGRFSAVTITVPMIIGHESGGDC